MAIVVEDHDGEKVATVAVKSNFDLTIHTDTDNAEDIEDAVRAGRSLQTTVSTVSTPEDGSPSPTGTGEQRAEASEEQKVSKIRGLIEQWTDYTTTIKD